MSPLTIELVEGTERVIADYRQDQLPAITLGLYEAFMARGEAGMDALLAYTHLLYTYRRQNTNQVFALVKYLQKGLSMGRNKVTAARATLKEMELIKDITIRGEGGKITGHYTLLNLLPNPGPSTIPESGRVDTTIPENHTVAKPAAGDRRQILEEEIKESTSRGGGFGAHGL